MYRNVAFSTSLLLASLLTAPLCQAAGLSAGAARIDITNRENPAPVPLSARALVLKKSDVTVAILTLDVVSFGKIGSIKDDFIPKLRARAAAELGIEPRNVLFNASHCHGVPCSDVLELSLIHISETTRPY